MAESLYERRDRKSAISFQRCHFDPKFQVEGVAPTNHFRTIKHLSVIARRHALYAQIDDKDLWSVSWIIWLISKPVL